MASSSVFVGMVTHARSRFNVDGAAASMTLGLAEQLREVGLEVEVFVSDRDDYDPVAMPLRRTTLVRSAVHQAALERRWRRYLVAGGAAGRGAASDLVVQTGMAGKRVSQSIGRQPWKAAPDLPGAKAVTRLLNIDLSHLRLMAEADAYSSEWTLILEDDAGVADLALAARQLAWLTAALSDTYVDFASLSESLSLDELGVAELLQPAGDIPVPTNLGLVLMRATRPITNTVCATLYRTSYLRKLRASILRSGLSPVAPIDWRVNEAIMDLVDQGELDEQSCVWVKPGIFLQRSMHDPA